MNELSSRMTEAKYMQSIPTRRGGMRGCGGNLKQSGSCGGLGISGETTFYDRRIEMNHMNHADELLQEQPPIGAEQVKELTAVLQKYKSGKAQTERRIIASENWWKLRNSLEEAHVQGKDGGFRSVSGWLHNVIVSKHADAMDAYPVPCILPREPSDCGQAQILSSILPCILEQNRFESTYSDAMWQKLKTGTGVYKVVWDPSRLNGLGDIAIERVNLLNIFWEPGVNDIQRSRYLFHTEPVDKDILRSRYPEQLSSRLKSPTFLASRFLYDDAVDTSDKATVVEVYYRKLVDGRNTLQYIKYVEDVVLFATENDPELAMTGLYDHGMYPYVFDALFPIEGSPCGYGFVDLCKNPQTEIDLMKTAFVKNAMVGATPRYFSRGDGSINEEEFLDLSNPIVHTTSSLNEDYLRRIEHIGLDGNYVSVLDRTIQELRETSGNTETSTGNISNGVTAASAIAALQEASGKGSRDSVRAAYRAYGQIIELCIELIRQFYDLPRQFRIVGGMGGEQFVSFDNAGLLPVYQGELYGEDMGYRLPVFDIKISAQKQSAYSRMAQNELALQLYGAGLFDPMRTDQAVMCLEMMDFEGKDRLLQQLGGRTSLHRRLADYMQLALTLARKAEPDMVPAIAGDIAALSNGIAPKGVRPITGGEPGHIRNARSRGAKGGQL